MAEEQSGGGIPVGSSVGRSSRARSSLGRSSPGQPSPDGISLGDLAVRFGCDLKGDPAGVVRRVATLGNAGPDALTFLANPSYRSQLSSTRAGAVILKRELAGECPVAVLVADVPSAAYARMAAVLHPPPVFEQGVHASAVVAPTASIEPSAHIAANVVIGEDVTICAAAVVGAGCVIGPRCRLGAATRLHANVTLVEDVRLGARCIVHSGAVIGSDGFGNARDSEAWIKVPQVGGVTVGATYSLGRDTASVGGPAATNCPGEAADSRQCRQWTALVKYDTPSFGLAASHDVLHGGPRVRPAWIAWNTRRPPLDDAVGLQLVHAAGDAALAAVIVERHHGARRARARRHRGGGRRRDGHDPPGAAPAGDRPGRGGWSRRGGLRDGPRPTVRGRRGTGCRAGAGGVERVVGRAVGIRGALHSGRSVCR